MAVSYTHLDVYKRQVDDSAGASGGPEERTGADGVPDELVVAEESLVDTVALTPSGGLMPDPFVEGGGRLGLSLIHI